MRRLHPITGKDDGSPLYVVAREHVGAEHLNAGLDWAARAEEAATREHDFSGRHIRGFHPFAAIHFRMPQWGNPSVYGEVTREGYIHPNSKLLELTEETDGPLFTIKGQNQDGEALIEVVGPYPLPVGYGGIVANNNRGAPEIGTGGMDYGRGWIEPIDVWSFVFKLNNPASVAGRSMFQRGILYNDFCVYIHGGD